MTDSTYDPFPAAAILAEATRSGARLAALPADCRPQTLDQGYDLQDAVMRHSRERGGWKLGVGSPAQLRAAGLRRPLIGQLEAARCHADGAALRLPPDGSVTVECEIAFVLDRDIPPARERVPAPADIRHASVTLELVRSRFVDRRAVGWPSFVGDNVGFEALVVSQPFCLGLDADALKRVNDSAIVTLDGEIQASALSGEAATDPIRSLTALFAHAAERGLTLKAGEIVTTGAMCQPFDVPAAAGHTISVSYAGGALTTTLI